MDPFAEADAHLTDAVAELERGASHLAESRTLDPLVAHHLERAHHHVTEARRLVILQKRTLLAA